MMKKKPSASMTHHLQIVPEAGAVAHRVLHLEAKLPVGFGAGRGLNNPFSLNELDRPSIAEGAADPNDFLPRLAAAGIEVRGPRPPLPHRSSAWHLWPEDGCPAVACTGK